MRPTGFWLLWLVFIIGISDFRTVMHLAGKVSICYGQFGGICLNLPKRSAGRGLHNVLLLLDTCKAEKSCHACNFNPQVLGYLHDINICGPSL